MKKTKFLIVLLALALTFAVFTACAGENEADGPTCSIVITAADVLENKDLIAAEKLDLVPDDGIIYSGEITFKEGDNLLDTVISALQKEKIHYEQQGGTYFTAFGNIYSSDCQFGGWMYKVNGEEPSVGANEFKLSDGDKAEFFYVCDYNAYFAQ